MNTQQQSELKVFPREQPGEKNGRGKSLSSEFISSRNSNNVTNKHHQQRRQLFEFYADKRSSLVVKNVLTQTVSSTESAFRQFTQS